MAENWVEQGLRLVKDEEKRIVQKPPKPASNPVLRKYFKDQEMKLEKKEMAVWLAENVLGYKHYPSIQLNDKWCESHWEAKDLNAPTIYCDPDNNKKLEEFLYSPDGFFAVWDALDFVSVNFFSALKSGDVQCDIDTYKKGHIVKDGKDRYEAFYNAVFEAMNK